MERLEVHVKHSRTHLQAPQPQGESLKAHAPLLQAQAQKGRRCTPQGACQLAACCRRGRNPGGPPPSIVLLSASLCCGLASLLIQLPASAAESPAAKKGGSIYHKDDDEEGGPLTLHEAAEQGLGKEIARWGAGLSLLHGHGAGAPARVQADR